MLGAEGVVDGAEARAEVDVEGTHYGGTGTDDGEIDFDSGLCISEMSKEEREIKHTFVSERCQCRPRFHRRRGSPMSRTFEQCTQRR